MPSSALFIFYPLCFVVDLYLRDYPGRISEYGIPRGDVLEYHCAKADTGTVPDMNILSDTGACCQKYIFPDLNVSHNIAVAADDGIISDLRIMTDGRGKKRYEIADRRIGREL